MVINAGKMASEDERGGRTLWRVTIANGQMRDEVGIFSRLGNGQQCPTVLGGQDANDGHSYFME